MLDYLEHPLGLACRKGVIEGGRQVKQHHGASKKSRTKDQFAQSRRAACMIRNGWPPVPPSVRYHG